MKKTLNVTVSKTLMVCLNPGITGKIVETKRNGLSAVFKNNNYIYICVCIYIYIYFDEAEPYI